ncbi:MAG: CsbD family protein [Deltaproteobacteria bacterium]|nr:CsbD family protein [Deltaproteobacteria bacterium]
MNNDRMKGKWHQLKGEIKRKWGKVTDDDLTEAEGNMEKLVGKIQERTGERRAAIEKWIDSQSM